MVTHTQRTDSYDDDTVDDYHTSATRDSGTNWWPLLLIPLFLLVALAGVSAYQNGFSNGSESTSTTLQPSVIQNNNGGITEPNSAQMGIGGAPEVSPTPTLPPISIAPPEPDTEY